MPRAATHRPRIVEAIQQAGDAGITTSEIADRLGFKIQQVYKDIKKLEDAGEVQRHPGVGPKGGDLLTWAGGEASVTVDPRAAGIPPAKLEHGKGGSNGNGNGKGPATIAGAKVGGAGLVLGKTYRVTGVELSNGGEVEVTMTDDQGNTISLEVEG